MTVMKATVMVKNANIKTAVIINADFYISNGGDHGGGDDNGGANYDDTKTRAGK